MAKIIIGKTVGGVAIAVETAVKGPTDNSELFASFSERDKFDALLALGYLLVSEIRKNSGDKAWIDAIRLTHFHLESSLGTQTVAIWKKRLSINSAFAARDYGKDLTRIHFRYL